MDVLGQQEAKQGARSELAVQGCTYRGSRGWAEESCFQAFLLKLSVSSTFKQVLSDIMHLFFFKIIEICIGFDGWKVQQT